MPARPPPRVPELAEAVPVVGKRKLSFDDAGRKRLKTFLDEHPKEKVLVAIERFAGEHGVVDVPAGAGAGAWDEDLRAVVDGGLDMLRAMGGSRQGFHDTLFKRLSSSMGSSFAAWAAEEPPVTLVTLLHWLADACGHSRVEDLFYRGVGAVLRGPTRSPSVLTERTRATLLAKPLISLPYPEVRGRLWAYAPDRFRSDVAVIQDALHSDECLADIFSYQYQMEGIMTYTSRLGSSNPPFIDPDNPPPQLLSIAQPIALALAEQPALRAHMEAHAAERPDPEFYFVLCYADWGLLRLLVELTDSLVTLTAPGFGKLPPRVLNLATSPIEEAFLPKYRGAHYTEALRLPYTMAGLHLVLLHTAHSGAANARPLTTALFKLVCRVHGEDASEAVFAQLIKGIMEGPLNPNLKGVEGGVLINIVLYMVLGLLASLPGAMPPCRALLGYVERAIHNRGVYREGVYYVLALLITAVGQHLRQERPDLLPMADALAQMILLPLAAQDIMYPDLVEFLRESCLYAADEPPPAHVQEVCEVYAAAYEGQEGAEGGGEAV